MLPTSVLSKYLHLFYFAELVFIYNDLCKLFLVSPGDGNSASGHKNPRLKLISSVWCRGTNNSDRLCRFENLCYSPSVQQFLFFKDFKSVISGVPKDRFSPALIDFSSVADHNKMLFNYVELPAEFSTKFKTVNTNSCALIFKRFNPENLMHVFHDDLLPLYYTAEEIGILKSSYCKKAILVFADDRPPGPYSALYNLFFDSKPLYLSSHEDESLICFKDSFIGLNKHTTWYQYGFKEPQGALIKDYSHMADFISKFTGYYKQQFASDKKFSNCSVLVTRKQNRKILNENQVVTCLEKETLTKVHRFDIENEDILHVINVISQCKFLVGMHGAALILSLFLAPGAAIIELFPYGVPAEYYTPYKTLTLFPGRNVIYRSWENVIKSNSHPHPNNPPEFGGISHLSIQEQTWIKNLEFVKPQLCCYNPEWLYFVYQDTLIDIDSFTDVIKDAKRECDKFNGANLHDSNGIKPVIYPAEVQKLSCNFDATEYKTPSTFHLYWYPPWNLAFTNFTTLEYEIWLQISGTVNVTAYLTKQTKFTVDYSNVNFLIWIRCIVDGTYAGPFTTNPLICFENL